MKTITITSKDLKCDSTLISELAYASKQWTEDDLWENNFSYEPNEPYDYNYENDLFKHTKTLKDFQKIADILEIKTEGTLQLQKKLQDGASIALNQPEIWRKLLEAYKDKLQEDRTDGISKDYNQDLQENIDSYQQDLYKEWLNGGQERDNNGVIYEISKYFTTNTDGEYDKNTDSYTFSLDDEDLANYK